MGKDIGGLLMAKKFLLIGMPGWNVNYPLLALAYLGGIIRDAGWKCKIEDLNIKVFRLVSQEDRAYWNESQWAVWYRREFIDRLYEKYGSDIEDLLLSLGRDDDYDIIGFTVNALTRHFTLDASHFLKSLHPNTPIIFGGPSCFPARHNKQFFEERGAPDIICQGEAEIALPDFLKEFAARGDYRTSVRGFAYQDAVEIIDTGEPGLPEFDANTALPDWTQCDFSLYTQPGDFPIFFSRGCHYKCAFCADRVDFKKFRIRKAIHVTDEIKAALHYACPYSTRPIVHFSDQLVNGDIAELEKLCDLIIESASQIYWHAQARFRPEMTRSLLERMHNAGCRHLSWGFESASQNVINLMRKNYDHDMARRIILDAYEVGIQNYLPLIVGFPGETVTDFIKTALFVLDFAPYAYFEDPNLLFIPPSSSLHKNYKKWDLLNNAACSWVSKDHRNDMDVRMFRQFVLRNAIENTSLAAHAVVGWDDMSQVDFNRYAVASDIAGVLYGLWTECGMEKRMVNLLTQWNKHTFSGAPVRHIRHWHPENVPQSVSLENWFAGDKNSDEQRIRICNCVFEALRDVLDRQDNSIPKGQ
jgi:radical SAM superfamily enzyme YgiQ (UPF0313 family)